MWTLLSLHRDGPFSRQLPGASRPYTAPLKTDKEQEKRVVSGCSHTSHDAHAGHFRQRAL